MIGTCGVVPRGIYHVPIENGDGNFEAESNFEEEVDVVLKSRSIVAYYGEVLAVLNSLSR